MSEAAHKAMRRDLRRAVGPAAVQLLADLVAGLQQLTARLDQLEATHHQGVRTQEQRQITTLQAVQALGDRARGVNTLIDRGFWGRLRWLVTGR